MAPVYLGFIETLQDILRKLFNDVLSPVIESVFNFLLDAVLKLVSEAFSELLLDGLIGMLTIIHYLEGLFDIFSGAADIVYNGERMAILKMMFHLNGIEMALFALTVMAGCLAFLFAVIQTGKSISGSVLDSEYKPISKVLGEGLKSMLAFMLVPLLCLVIHEGSNVIFEQIDLVFDKTMKSEAKMGIDDIIFNSVAQSAVSESTDFEKSYQNASQKYRNRSQVVTDFDIKKIDYMTGYVCGILILLILLGAGIMFIRRCFDLLVLYLVSPVFSATIALDGGARFAKWREQFVGRFFSTFGSVFSMRLYLMVMPLFSSGSIKYSGDLALDNFMKLFVIIGGAWAVYKGNGMISQLLLGQSAEEGMGAALGLAALVRGGARRLSGKG